MSNHPQGENILAVLAGLTVSGAAAIPHDLYAQVICKGALDPRKELVLTRLTTIGIGAFTQGRGVQLDDDGHLR